MSVLVEGMEMPKYCCDCPFSHQKGEYPFWCYAGDFSVRAFEKRLEVSKCPLVEVETPHGRLADLDAALKCVDDDSIEDCDAKWQAIRLFDWAMSKRVVIEAED